jgi:hypothetical protein
MEFCFLEPERYVEWDDFVDISPQGSIYSKSYYLDAIGLPYKVGVLLKGEKIQGGIVLIKNEIRMYSNPMFVRYLGVLLRPTEGSYANKISTKMNIIDKLVSNLSGYKSFDYTFHPSFSNWLPFYWAGYKQETRYTYQIRNLENVNEIYNNVQSKVRKNMRKAERGNIYIKQDIRLEDFFNINKLSFERQGGKIPYSFSFLQRFYEKLHSYEMIKLFGALDANGRYHAVCGVIYDKKSCNFILNGYDPNIENCEANTLLVMETIKFAAKVSKVFDFEGSMIKPIEKFYRGFGAILTPYYNIWKGNLRNNIKRYALKKYKKIKYGK